MQRAKQAERSERERRERRGDNDRKQWALFIFDNPFFGFSLVLGFCHNMNKLENKISGHSRPLIVILI